MANRAAIVIALLLVAGVYSARSGAAEAVVTGIAVVRAP